MKKLDLAGYRESWPWHSTLGTWLHVYPGHFSYEHKRKASPSGVPFQEKIQ